MYLVTSGGQAGTNAVNPNLVLMAALGPCDTLSSSPVVVNEVTTFASAWAVSPFAANPLTTGLTSYLNIGSSRSNTAGLANAFAAVNNLVNLTAGQALFTVPAGNAVVPYGEINSLADILNACAVTGGGTAGDGSACGDLFTDANPYTSVTGTVYSGIPTDTLQAVMEIVQNPACNGQGGLSYSINCSGNSVDTPALFSFLSLNSPFQPIQTAAPNDLSLSLNFTSGGGLTGTSGADFFALDAPGNLWITNTRANSVTEWNNQGAAVSPSSGFTAGSLVSPGSIAVDPSGNIWVCDDGALTELSSLGTEEEGSPFGGGGLTASGCQDMAIDGSGNIWTVNSSSVSKFTDLGAPLSPAGGYTIPISPTDATTVNPLPPVAIDESGNVWVGADYESYLSLAELNNASGLPYYLSPSPSVSGQQSPSNFVNVGTDQSETQIAIDGSGNVWIPNGGSTSGDLLKVPPYAGTGTTDFPGAFFSVSGGGHINPLVNARGVAIDGAGMVWVGSVGTSASSGLSNLSEFYPSNSAIFSDYASSSLANRALSVSVDGSGNVWVLLDNDTITEYVGLATPAVTPLSLAVEKKKLGAEP
jgi:streptogramin lyase